MNKVTLVRHDSKYIHSLYELSNDPDIFEHLNFENPSIKDTEAFVRYVMKAEKIGQEVSRVILNNKKEAIGVITLMDINQKLCHCHIGFWIGKKYWGKGLAKEALDQMLIIAFDQLNMELVFAGARMKNVRSQKFQDKIPYITKNVNEHYGDVLHALETKENTKCVLNVIKKEDFKKYMFK